MQKCTKCGVDKPLTEYSSNGAGLTKRRCKPCRSADESARYAAKPLQVRQVVMARIKEWGKRNPDKHRDYAATTRANNPDHYRLKVRLRRRKHRVATPAWADKQRIASIYKEAVARTKLTGIPHDVDHVVPLKHPLVCGLHVEHNLQVLPACDNRSKNNRHWPDMP